MTKEDLDAIEARAKAATEGPWDATLLNDWADQTTIEGPQFVSGQVELPPEPDPEVQRQIHADAQFIAAARSDVPALVAEVRALRKALYDAREAIDSECGRRHSAACDAVTAILGDSGPEVLTKSP